MGPDYCFRRSHCLEIVRNYHVSITYLLGLLTSCVFIMFLLDIIY